MKDGVLPNLRVRPRTIDSHRSMNRPSGTEPKGCDLTSVEITNAPLTDTSNKDFFPKRNQRFTTKPVQMEGVAINKDPILS